MNPDTDENGNDYLAQDERLGAKTVTISSPIGPITCFHHLVSRHLFQRVSEKRSKVYFSKIREKIHRAASSCLDL